MRTQTWWVASMTRVSGSSLSRALQFTCERFTLPSQEEIGIRA